MSDLKLVPLKDLVDEVLSRLDCGMVMGQLKDNRNDKVEQLIATSSSMLKIAHMISLFMASEELKIKKCTEQTFMPDINESGAMQLAAAMNLAVHNKKEILSLSKKDMDNRDPLVMLPVLIGIIKRNVEDDN